MDSTNESQQNNIEKSQIVWNPSKLPLTVEISTETEKAETAMNDVTFIYKYGNVKIKSKIRDGTVAQESERKKAYTKPHLFIRLALWISRVHRKTHTSIKKELIQSGRTHAIISCVAQQLLSCRLFALSSAFLGRC